MNLESLLLVTVAFAIENEPGSKTRPTGYIARRKSDKGGCPDSRYKRGISFYQPPDFITIDSADGGTGAAPQSRMVYVGMHVKPRALPRPVSTF